MSISFVHEALKVMRRGKSDGCEGLTSDYLKNVNSLYKFIFNLYIQICRQVLQFNPVSDS